MKKIATAAIGMMIACTASYGQTAENLERAEQAFRNYDFDQAEELLKPAKVRKGKRTVAGTMTPEGQDLLDRVERARNFMERVERLEILDSVSVPLDKLPKAYRLPESAGTLSDGSQLGTPNPDVDYVFTNEGGDYQIWSEPDSVGRMTLMESNRLTDGTWSAPQALPDLNVGERDAIFPFMMGDGFTLYYTLHDPEGIGGYDIMVATRDQSDGTFMQPQNLGMPYNSPADDYLLAIDEQNGVGWFATNRNETEDSGNVTVYMYKVNDMRQNYSPDDEDLKDLALLHDWMMTQDPAADYTDLISTVKSIQPGAPKRQTDFLLPMDGGKVYRYYSDFQSKQAAALMKKYLNQKAQLDKQEQRLADLRRSFHEEHATVQRRQIMQIEEHIDKDRKDVHDILSQVYSAERKAK